MSMETKEIKQMLDDEFLERLLKATTDEEIKELFKEKGLQIGDAQIVDLKENFAKNLTDEMLSNVSGGWTNAKHSAASGALWTSVSGMALGAVAGLVIGIVDAEHRKDQGMDSVPKRALICLRDTVASMAAVGAVGAAVGAGVGAAGGALYSH